MIQTILFAIYFWILVVVNLVWLIPYGIVRLFGRKAGDRFMGRLIGIWARNLFTVGRVKFNIYGRENIPEDRRDLCIIGNHQSLVDIAVVYAAFNINAGFIAKAELGKVPFLNLWIMVMHCVLLKRKKRKSAIEAIEKGVSNIKNGHPMIIFPEGTRSRSNGMRPFKPGSFKLAFRSNAVIIPMTIDGAWNVIASGKVSGGEITATIHKPVETEYLTPEQRKELPGQLWTVVNQGLKKPEEFVPGSEYGI